MKSIISKGFYKYKYSEWNLPQSKSYINPDMSITYNVNMSGTYTTALYNLFFGGKSTINANANNATRYVKCVFNSILKPDTYTIDFTWSKQANVSVKEMVWSVIYEDGSVEQVLDSTSSTSSSATFSTKKRIVGLNFDLYAGSGTNQYCFYTMGPLIFKSSSMNDNVVQRQTGLEESNSSSYDIIRNNYYNFVTENGMMSYK